MSVSPGVRLVASIRAEVQAKLFPATAQRSEEPVGGAPEFTVGRGLREPEDPCEAPA
ncbi:MAG: hypothetical protein GY910_09125 [bacterium]|nr:hypothetical protein [bacterium]